MVMRTLLALALVTVLSACTRTTGEAPEPTAEPSSAVETARPLAVTGPPRIPYVERSVLRFPDGRTVQLPTEWGHTSIVRYAGGYLTTDDRAVEGALGMHRLGADGSLLDSWTSTGPALVGRGGRVAWLSFVPSEGGMTGPTLLHTDAVDGGDEVSQRLDRSRIPFLTGWFRGRVVYDAWGESSSFLTDLVHPPRPVPKAEDVGVARADGIYTARLTREGLEFRYLDGSLVDAVRTRGLGRALSTDLAWEDDEHVLTTLVRGRRQAVVRIAKGGGVSLATPWRRTDRTGFAFLAR